MSARRAWLVAAPSLLLAACGDVPPDSIESERGAILGGQVDAEHTAVVGVTTTHDRAIGICSGTIISVEDRFAVVLTAAHCVVELDGEGEVTTPAVPLAAARITVTLGGDIANDTLRGRTMRAVSVAVAPGYDGYTGSPDDVALVRIAGDTAALPHVSVLQEADDELGPGSAVTLVGFGDTEVLNTAGERRATPQVVEWVNPSFIGFDQTGGRGVCAGDSGGPVLVSVGGGLAVAGVTSFVHGQADAPCTGGATTIRISQHADFIARQGQALPPVVAGCSVASGHRASNHEAAAVSLSVMVLIWFQKRRRRTANQ